MSGYLGPRMERPAAAAGSCSPPHSQLVNDIPGRRGPVDKSLRLLASAALLSVLLYAVMYFHLAIYSYLPFAFAGSFLIHVRSGASRRSWLAAVGVGALYALVYIARRMPVEWLDCVGFPGVGSVAILGVEAIWSAPDRRTKACRQFGVAILFPVFLACTGFALASTARFHPKTLDLYLYNFDASLGFQPSFAMGRLFRHSALLQRVCFLVYQGLPLAMAYAFSIELTGNRRHTADIVKAFLCAGVFGYLLYNVFPAAGPVYVFGDRFPALPPSPPPVPAPLELGSTPRNDMPSVHLGVALLIFWRSRAWNPVPRLIAGAVLFLTVLATLGFGEHYFVDLVVAVPFAQGVEAIATASPRLFRLRAACAAAGALMVAAWLLYLRRPAPPVPPLLPWCAVAITVASTLALRRALHHAAIAARGEAQVHASET